MKFEHYEMVIGLEVHCELNTKTKIFCSCPTTFGADPNTQVCPVCLGMPGTLPVLNEEVVNFAIKAGLATNCKIATHSKLDRKNYFYPDLPKAYQTSQFDLPLCFAGALEIETNKVSKKIGITRIHIEEDAGKLLHNEIQGTMIDCNRCGVPLIEIVSEPDMRSAEEAVAFFKKLRAILLYIGISDCKMNEGSLRCDVNLSVRKMGETKYGTRTEIKNLNSFQFVAKAIEYEYKRQIHSLENGENIVQETRRFNRKNGETFSLRTKENANDYRYFPDPDFAPIEISKNTVDKILKDIPLLPDARKNILCTAYKLSSYDAELIVTEKDIADYFENAAKQTTFTKVLTNLFVGDVLKILNEEGDKNPKMDASSFAEISQLIGTGYINNQIGKKLVYQLWNKPSIASVKEYVDEQGFAQINNKEVLAKYVNEVIDNSPKFVTDYKNGKTNVLKAIVGQVMAKTAGNGNPVMIHDIILKTLNADEAEL